MQIIASIESFVILPSPLEGFSQLPSCFLFMHPRSIYGTVLAGLVIVIAIVRPKKVFVWIELGFASAEIRINSHRIPTVVPSEVE